MNKELQAYVVKVFPEVIKKTKDWSDFKSMKVLIEWDREEEYPSRIVLEQWWDKKCEVAKSLQEWKEYIFSLNFRANERSDANWTQTAFGSISAWRAQPMLEGWTAEDNSWLPF